MGLFNWLFGKKNDSKLSKDSEAITKADKKIEDTDTKASADKVEKEEVVTLAKETIPTHETAVSSEKASTEKKKSVVKKAATTTPKDKAPKEETEEATPLKEEITEIELEVPSEPLSQEAITDPAITGRFEINRSKDGKKYFFNLYASNRVGIATSQMYSTAQSALIGVKSVIANAAKAPIEDQTLKTYETLPFPKWIIYIDKGGKYRFHLSAANGSNVCHSQGYTTKGSCKNGIESIIRSSKNPEINKAYLIK